MSFFGKLRDRLFKSSSKLEEGLDAIVDDGGELEEATEALSAEDQAVSDAKAAELAAEQEREAARQEAERIAEEQRLAAEQRKAEAQRQADLAHQAELARQAELDRQAEIARLERERAIAEAEKEKAAEQEQARIDAEEAKRRLEALAKQAEMERQAEQERLARLERQAEQERKAEQQRLADEAARAQEKARLERERAEQARIEKVQKEQAVKQAADAEKAQSRPGIIGRLLGRGRSGPVMRRTLDDDMLEQLEELLITSDMGVDTALRVVANIAEGRMGRKVSTAELKGLLADEITRIMEPVAKPLPIYPNKPQIVLVVGVNGSGKTTTIGKLASQFRAAGKSVMIAAGDTFRAAAVEQLQVWDERAGVPVLTAPEGSDPASLAFEAIDRATAEGVDLLMIDTAGRLQNRQDLMEELAKIVRVIKRKDENAPHNTLLVLDATTGQNALSQVDIFRQLADVSGLVMTKLDGTAKGGVLVALADKFGLPIHAIGVGEKIDDLDAFDAREFALALTGSDQ